MRKRKLTSGLIKHLSKIFPNNQELGEEVRKIVNESNRQKHNHRKDR